MSGPSESKVGGGSLCEVVAGTVAGMVDDPGFGDHQARRHVASCLRCQAELARYRRMRRVMQELREERITPAPGTLASVLTAIEGAGQSGPGRLVPAGRRVAYVGGAAMATAAAGAAGVIVWVSRRRMSLAS